MLREFITAFESQSSFEGSKDEAGFMYPVLVSIRLKTTVK